MSCFEDDEDGTHVVSAVVLLFIVSQLFIEQRFHYLLQTHHGESFPNPLYHRLVVLCLPNAIASHYDEIDSLPINPSDVRRGTDHLLCRVQLSVVLELNVPDRPR